MRRWIFLSLAVLVAASAAYLYLRRDELRLQWDSYQVTSSPDYATFQQRMAEFQQQAVTYAQLQALVSRWQTGNEPFDGYLARYLFDAPCNEAVREAFSRELSWRDGHVEAWGGAWQEQKGDIKEQVESLRRYLDTLQAAVPSRAITWRDVLDIQAMFALSDQPTLAIRLTPDNWRERYQRWLIAKDD
jgi:hypothetical protein